MPFLIVQKPSKLPFSIAVVSACLNFSHPNHNILIFGRQVKYIYWSVMAERNVPLSLRRSQSQSEQPRPRRSLSLGDCFSCRAALMMPNQWLDHPDSEVLNDAKDVQPSNGVQTPRAEIKRRISREDNCILDSPHLSSLTDNMNKFGVSSPRCSYRIGNPTTLQGDLIYLLIKYYLGFATETSILQLIGKILTSIYREW